MTIHSVYDDEFRSYGRVVSGYDFSELLSALEKTPLNKEGTAYVASEPSLEALDIKKVLERNLYGGMPIQLGYCNGHNRTLNCLEYHRDSEYNLGSEDFILLLALRSEIDDFQLDTSKVKAFLVPKGVMVEVFATALHYAPCHVSDDGFRVLVLLPLNTNTDIELPEVVDSEDKLLWARNKWLLAHKDTSEAKNGAYIGLVGDNITL